MKGPLWISLIVVVLGGSAGNFLRYAQTKANQPPKFETIPYSLDGFRGEERRFDEFSYDVLKADTTTLRLYLDEKGVPYWLFIGYFSSQKYGSQIHSPRHCLPGGGWRIESLEEAGLPESAGGRSVNRVVIGNGYQKQLMVYWFETRTGPLRNEFALKLDLVKNSLRLRPTDAAFVRLTLPIVGDNAHEAWRKALGFLSAFDAAIDAALPFDN